jgi:type I restriction enzyme S subunit
VSRKPKATAPKEETTPTLVPKLRFPEFREAEGWKERLIGEFLSESRLPGSKGNVAKKITVKLWGNGVFEKNESIQGSINTQYFQRKAGQFIYSKLDFLNQAFGIIPRSLDNFESTVDLPCFDIRQGLNPLFFLEYVKRRDFYERLGETADGSRKARRIHAETFLSFSVALPTPSEQQKIAECLSSVDDLIAAQARKVDALKTHKKGLMQQLFPREGETQPRLRFPEFQNAGDWEEKSLGQLIEIASGQVDPKQPPYCDYPQIGSEDIKSDSGKLVNGKSAAEKGVISGNYTFDENDILYSKIRPALNKVAAPAFRGICSADIYPIRPADANLLKRYLFYLLLSQDFLKYAIRNSERGKIPKINRDALVTYKTLIPSPAEQHRIASCLSSLDDLITAEGQKLEGLKTHKRGLMQQLFPSAVEA